mgnify:CR=1 FL=1
MAITDHAEWHEGGDGFANVKGYLTAVDNCRQTFEPQGLTILSGVELGDPPEFAPLTARVLPTNLAGIRHHPTHPYRQKRPARFIIQDQRQSENCYRLSGIVK